MEKRESIVSLTREFAVPRERVFAAWTDAAQLEPFGGVDRSGVCRPERAEPKQPNAERRLQ